MGLRRRGLRYKTAAGSGHCCLDSNEVKCYMCWPRKRAGRGSGAVSAPNIMGTLAAGEYCVQLFPHLLCVSMYLDE